MPYKFHLSNIKSVEEKNKTGTFLSPLENVVWLWSGNLHDRLPMNRENDCLLNEGTLSQFGILLMLMAFWCPWTDHWNVMWSDGIQEDSNTKFGDEQALKWGKEARKALLPFCMFDHYYSIQFSIFLSFSLLPCVYFSRDSFHSKIENYAQTIYLFLWFNNKQKEWGRGNMVIFREKNNV